MLKSGELEGRVAIVSMGSEQEMRALVPNLKKFYGEKAPQIVVSGSIQPNFSVADFYRSSLNPLAELFFPSSLSLSISSGSAINKVSSDILKKAAESAELIDNILIITQGLIASAVLYKIHSLSADLHFQVCSGYAIAVNEQGKHYVIDRDNITIDARY